MLGGCSLKRDNFSLEGPVAVFIRPQANRITQLLEVKDMSKNGISTILLLKTAVCALAVALIFVLLRPPLLQAQGNTADVLGTVTDPSGAVVADAKVTIKNTATGVVRKAQTAQSGEFSVSLLQIGTYQVTVEAKGFKLYVAKDLTLAAGDRVRVDANLTVGATSESVEVSSSAVVGLQTDTSTVGTLVPDQSVQELPLNGRNFINLVQMAAGVTTGVQNAVAGGTRNNDLRQTNAYSANGQNDSENSNLIDGFDNSERLVGSMGVKPSIDAIQEVKVSTNLYSSEYSRTAGAVVDVVTKSGANRFSGSLYEFLRNDDLDARDYFATAGVVAKNKLRQNQFGGSLGGPIRKGRTFFFGDYEGFRQISGVATATDTVPTSAEEQAVAAAPVGSTVSIVDPQQGSGTYTATVSAIGKALMSLYPAPTPNLSPNPFYNYVSVPVRTQYSHTFDVRIDQHFSDKNTLFGRYSWNKVNTRMPEGFPGVKVGSQTVYPGGAINRQNNQGLSTTEAQHLGLSYLHIYRPNLLLELKAGYMRYNNTFLPLNGLNAATNLGFVCNSSDCVNYPLGGSQWGLPAWSFSGFYGVSSDDEGGNPLFDINNTFMYSGSITWTKGAHSIKAGLSLLRRQVDYEQSQEGRGTFTFTGTLTGDPLTDMIQGYAGAYSRQQELGFPNYRMWEPGGYIQDDWRAKSWLTLNLGVRYDIFTPYTEVNGYISNFDPVKGVIVSPNLPGSITAVKLLTLRSITAISLRVSVLLPPCSTAWLCAADLESHIFQARRDLNRFWPILPSPTPQLAPEARRIRPTGKLAPPR